MPDPGYAPSPYTTARRGKIVGFTELVLAGVGLAIAAILAASADMGLWGLLLVGPLVIIPTGVAIARNLLIREMLRSERARQASSR